MNATNITSVNLEKSFSQAENLKNHTHTVHESHKDFKCQSWANHFLNSSQGIESELDDKE